MEPTIKASLGSTSGTVGDEYIVAHAEGQYQNVGTGSPRRRTDRTGEYFNPDAQRITYAEIQRFIIRMVDRMQEALDICDDPMLREDVLFSAKEYWALIFKNRKALQPVQREFLSHILTSMNSVTAVSSDNALSQLIDTVKYFGQNIKGLTEKDITALIAKLEEAGFELIAPLTDESSHDEKIDEEE